MKKIFFLTIIFISLSFSVKLTRIGYIDIQKIIDKVAADNNLIAVLEGKKSEYIKKAEELAKKIKLLKEKLEKEETTLSDERKKELNEEILFKKDELKQFLDEKNNELKNKEDKLSFTVLKEIYHTIKKIAEIKGYSIILEKNSSIIYADTKIDITQKLLDELEKQKQKKATN